MTQTPAAAPRPTFTGKLVEAEPGRIVLAIPGSDYRLHLAFSGDPGQINARLTGRVICEARKVFLAPVGGSYIEPIIGRPRKIQGRIQMISPATNEITVIAAGAIFVATLTHVGQQAGDFKLRQMIYFSIPSGARFER